MTAADPALLHRDPHYTYPVLIKGEGIYLYDEAGNRYIDGTAGAGNVTLGHGRHAIVEAMADQGRELAYCFSTFFTNPPALEYARRLAELAPGDLNHAYFVSGGSEGVETAIKLARLYYMQRGQTQKYQIIGRWRGYHGATLGALAATGMPGLRAPFEPYLPTFPHIASCYPYRCAFAGCKDRCNLTCARQLEEDHPRGRGRQHRRLYRRAGGHGWDRRRGAAAGLLPSYPRDLQRARRPLYRR